MVVKFAIDTARDVASGDAHRALPAILTFLLKLSLASYVITTFVPDVGHLATIAGGAVVAGLGTFVKFS